MVLANEGVFIAQEIRRILNTTILGLTPSVWLASNVNMFRPDPLGLAGPDPLGLADHTGLVPQSVTYVPGLLVTQVPRSYPAWSLYLKQTLAQQAQKVQLDTY